MDGRAVGARAPFAFDREAPGGLQAYKLLIEGAKRRYSPSAKALCAYYT